MTPTRSASEGAGKAGLPLERAGLARSAMGPLRTRPRLRFGLVFGIRYDTKPKCERGRGKSGPSARTRRLGSICDGPATHASSLALRVSIWDSLRHQPEAQAKARKERAFHSNAPAWL